VKPSFVPSALAPKPIRVYPVNPVKNLFAFISFHLYAQKIVHTALKNVQQSRPSILVSNDISTLIFGTLVAF